MSNKSRWREKKLVKSTESLNLEAARRRGGSHSPAWTDAPRAVWKRLIFEITRSLGWTRIDSAGRLPTPQECAEEFRETPFKPTELMRN